MATTHDIALFDHVELLEASNAARPAQPAPSSSSTTMARSRSVEFTWMPPEPILDRLEFVPLGKLCRLD